MLRITSIYIITILLSLVYTSPLRTSDSPQDNECILVVGSNRAHESDESCFAKTVWKEEHASLSYRDKPNVVTLDVQSAVNPGMHIVGNATTIVLPDTFKITTLYLERPWTFERDRVKTNLMEAVETNTVAHYVKNLLPRLSNGENVVIEWHPFVVRMDYYTKNDTQFVDNPALLKLKKTNPFTGFFDKTLSSIATRLALNKDISQQYHSSFIAEAKKLVPMIQKCINFYVSQGFSRNGIHKKLTLETEIIRLIYENENNIEAFKIAVPLAANITLFNTKVDHVGLIKKDGTIVYKKLVEKTKPVTVLDHYYTIPMNNVGLGTIYYFLWSDITAEINKNHAIECLETLGLKEVTLKRGTSPYNNRSNVWLLSGKKQA